MKATLEILEQTNPKLPSSKHKYHKAVLVSLNFGLFVTQVITHHDETLLYDFLRIFI